MTNAKDKTDRHLSVYTPADLAKAVQMIGASRGHFHFVLFHGKLVVEMKAEVADNSWWLNVRHTNSQWTLRIVHFGHLGLRPKPDNLSDWLAPGCHPRSCRKTECRKRISVTVQHVALGDQQHFRCTTWSNVVLERIPVWHCNRLDVPLSGRRRRWMTELVQTSTTWTSWEQWNPQKDDSLGLTVLFHGHQYRKRHWGPTEQAEI